MSDHRNLGIWKLRITASYDNKLDELKDTWNEEHTDIVREQITMGFDEAYVDLYSVADSDLDLRLGKQFVTVGIGDGISTLNLTEPVQALSVNDLSSRAVLVFVPTGITGYPYHRLCTASVANLSWP